MVFNNKLSSLSEALLSANQRQAADELALEVGQSTPPGFRREMGTSWEDDKREKDEDAHEGVPLLLDGEKGSVPWAAGWMRQGPLYAVGRNILFVVRDGRRNLLYILLWWFFSTSIALYNRYLVGKKHGRFPAPLLMTTVRFSVQAVVATVLLRARCCGGFPVSQITLQDYTFKIVPMGVLTAVDIGLTNLSYVLITVSFYTMCKSSTPVFLLVFAFIFRLEKPSFRLVSVILIICLGQFLTVRGEREFDAKGFALVMASAAVAGCRWSVTQRLCQKERFGMTNPLVTMYFIAPIVASTMLAWSACTEDWHLLSESRFFSTRRQTLLTFGIILLGCVLSFCIALSEFMLITHTSAVTFAVAGVAKELVTIMVSVAVMGDHLGPVNGIGLSIAIIGISLFNVVKMTQRWKQEDIPPTTSASGGLRDAKVEQVLSDAPEEEESMKS